LAGEDERGFDASKAELFEAIGHPNRIRIIQVLDEGPVGFAELKKRVGLESSGHLAFHLGKLRNLVTMNSDGQYALTGEGKEALRMIQMVREKGGQGRRPVMEVRRTLVAFLVVLIVVLAIVAAVQQMEIATRPSPPGTTLLNGRTFWYVAIPLTSLPAKGNVTVAFAGTEFTLVPSQSPVFTFQLSPNSTEGTVVLTPLNSSSTQTGIPMGVPITVTVTSNIPYGAVVKFADGTVEAMPNVAGTNAEGVSVHYFTSSLPWFSAHTSPQAAVSENMTAVTLYVSAGW